MFAFLKSFFDPGQKILNQYKDNPAAIREIIEEYKDKSDDELARIVNKYRDELKIIISKFPDDYSNNIRMRRKNEGLAKAELEVFEKLQKIMPSAFAALALTVDRTVGLMYYDVQLWAGTVLASGQKLVEMKTGEGKTITFLMPLFLYGLTGRGSHLVTVNDYLARRDGEYAGHIFAKLGVSVGIITPQASYRFVKDDDLKSEKGDDAAKEREGIEDIKLSNMNGINLVECSKDEAYGSDVVYGTNNEFGFDYLRDNMVKDLERRVQRELYFCIVDEADSILIDEARTPLIISAPASESNDMYRVFAQIVPKLRKEVDYIVEEKERAVSLTDEGIVRMEKFLKVKNIWEDYKLAHHLENALKAMAFYRRDDEYILKDGEVMIVDEFTGRVLKGRRYSEGLHQAIEAKENVQIQQESRTLATITFQNFFRLYKILTGGSGTIMTEQEEFFKIYNLESAAVPTNVPVTRKDESDRIYKSKEAKFNAVVEDIVETNKLGQPILVGTTSVADSEYISKKLEKRKVEHEVLNAKFHERESHIVENAGKIGAVTVATNMAGRGTDIPLGDGSLEKGGLYVLATERHESRRIDNQLRGRSGRQGNAGISRFYVSLEDQIMKMQGGDVVKKIMDMTNIPDDLPIEAGMVSKSIERSQKRMEGMYFDSRKRVVEYDDVVNQQREIFYTRRYRYLQLAEEFSKGEKLDETKAKLLDQFKEVLDELAGRFVYEVAQSTAGDQDAAEKGIKHTVAEILSLGTDDLFMNSANELKLFKDKISDLETLEKVLADQIQEKADSGSELQQFFLSFLRKTVELKIDSTNNLAGLVRKIFLDVMDELWTLHLDYMQDVREGIGLRGVAQLDPLVEYRNEGFKAFSNFVSRVNNQAVQGLLFVREISNNQNQRVRIGGQKVYTNAAQISDTLTGTREVVNPKISAAIDGALASGSKGSAAGQQLSRRDRRRVDRLDNAGKTKGRTK